MLKNIIVREDYINDMKFRYELQLNEDAYQREVLKELKMNLVFNDKEFNVEFGYIPQQATVCGALILDRVKNYEEMFAIFKMLNDFLEDDIDQLDVTELIEKQKKLARE